MPTPLKRGGRICVFRRFEGRLEDNLEGVLLVPLRKLKREFESTCFDLLTRRYHRNIVSFRGSSRASFLAPQIVQFASLVLQGATSDCHAHYVDASRTPKAKHADVRSLFSVDQIVLIDPLILREFCQTYKLAAVYCRAYTRLSERPFSGNKERIEVRKKDFCRTIAIDPFKGSRESAGLLSQANLWQKQLIRFD